MAVIVIAVTVRVVAVAVPLVVYTMAAVIVATAEALRYSINSPIRRSTGLVHALSGD